MGKFGIGTCAQCMNKAEVHVYPNDNPQAICENCHNENMKLEKKIQDKTVVKSSESIGYRLEPSNDERDQYIRVICNKASEEWVKSFIKEVVTRKVLTYDWRTIIRNERWFSILDLRRFALEIDPDMDKVEEKQGFSLQVNEKIQSSKIVKKTRKKKATEEPVNA